MTATPPRLAHWLLRRALPPDRYETIAGDLDELFHLEQLPRLGARRARWWFWRETIGIVSTRPLRRAAGPKRPAAPLVSPPRAAGPMRPAAPVASPPLLSPPRAALQLLLDEPRFRGGDRMHGLLHDIRFAIGALRKTPGFTAIAILTLALGIGGSTAMFTLVNALLLKPLPFKDPERLMLVNITVPDALVKRGLPREMVWSLAQYEQLFQTGQTAFEDSALVGAVGWNLTSAGRDPESLRGELIDSRYLSVLGITPVLGRDLSVDEDRAGVAPIALISHALWQRRFGGDVDAIGRTIGLNGTAHTIVGILPPGFSGLSGDGQVFVPMLSASNPMIADVRNPWRAAYLLIARRKADVSIAQAQSDVALIGSRHDAVFPPPPFVGVKGGFGASATPLDASRTDPLIRRALLVLLGAVGTVLLIGCVNLANLMLTRALARRREVAIRLAMGATRGRVVRQFLTESIIVSAVGAIAGVLVAMGAMKVAAWVLPEASLMLPRGSLAFTRVGIGMIALDGTTLLFALSLAALAAVVFGLMPAWQASRADVVHAIKTGGGGSIGGGIGTGSRAFGRGGAGAFRGVFSASNLLMIAETALALVLLVAAGLMLTSVRNLHAAGLGFEPDGLILSSLSLPAARYDRPRALQFVTTLLDDLRGQPGVQGAAFGMCAPLSGACAGTLAVRLDRPLAVGTAPMVGVVPATPEYFQTLGIRLIAGRAFTDRDRVGQPSVAIINETAARRLFPGEDPIGRRLRLTEIVDGEGAEIVGVAADVRYRPVEAAMAPDVYIPYLQAGLPSGFIFIRTRGDVAATTAAIRAVLRKLDPELPVVSVKTMGNRVGDATWRARLSADLLTLFAALALLLAAIGLYGVMAQAVVQRTQEIGVRMALGADRPRIFRLVIGRALVIGGIGVSIGIGVALLSTPLLESLLYQVKPRDPVTIACLAILLMAVTLFASYVPARRATRVDPLTTLRGD